MSDIVSVWLITDQQVSSRIWGRPPSASKTKTERFPSSDPAGEESVCWN